jgi:hypothetical protein
MCSSHPLFPYNQGKVTTYNLLRNEGESATFCLLDSEREFAANAPPFLYHLFFPKALGNFIVNSPYRIRIDVLCFDNFGILAKIYK